MDFAKIRREYVQKPMRLLDMDENPMREFGKWFDEAYKYYGEETNAMSLATADAQSRPSLRTVLLKGITKDGFIFYTNYLSRKGQQIHANPRVAILFYWAVLDRQIRIEGSVNKVPGEISDLYFSSRPTGSQISAVVSPQSQKVTLEELLENRSRIGDTESIRRPDHWGGFEIKADYFEFWNGQENRFHDRFVYEKTKEGSFDRYRIAP